MFVSPKGERRCCAGARSRRWILPRVSVAPGGPPSYAAGRFNATSYVLASRARAGHHRGRPPSRAASGYVRLPPGEHTRSAATAVARGREASDGRRGLLHEVPREARVHRLAGHAEERPPRAAGHMPGMRDQADEDHGHGRCEGDGVDGLTGDDDPVSSTATRALPG